MKPLKRKRKSQKKRLINPPMLELKSQKNEEMNLPEKMDSETQMNKLHIYNDNTEHTEQSIGTISLKAGEGAQTTTNHSCDIPQVYEEADSFANVFNNEKSVKFPVSWGKHTITFAKSKMVFAMHCKIC